MHTRGHKKRERDEATVTEVLLSFRPFRPPPMRPPPPTGECWMGAPLSAELRAAIVLMLMR